MPDDAGRGFTDAELYEHDFLAWSEKQAALLREHEAGLQWLDFENVLEEIESLGRSEKRAVASHLDRLLDHLLKVEFVGPERVIPHWRKEVRVQRKSLQADLTPTLRKRLPPLLQERYELSVGRMDVYASAAGRTATFPEICPYTWDKIVDPDFYPEPRYA